MPVVGVFLQGGTFKGPLLLVEERAAFPRTFFNSFASSIYNMSSLPPVYIVSAARTPTGQFLGYVHMLDSGVTS